MTTTHTDTAFALAGARTYFGELPVRDEAAMLKRVLHELTCVGRARPDCLVCFNEITHRIANRLLDLDREAAERWSSKGYVFDMAESELSAWPNATRAVVWAFDSAMAQPKIDKLVQEHVRH